MITAVNHTKQRQKLKNRKRKILFTITSLESEIEMKDRTILFYYKRDSFVESLPRDPSDLGKDANRRCRTSAVSSVSPSTADD
ncbi:hypothetical protein M9H77_22574 [Catharanthus roseus]|uniref:Uncharacterized protein n=1 Tax=Catharanthus roseus TaxID=4058 RepID=A0ACC0AR94_CATRO|nr:hypothetical protein M9H77_22574 [Catharanthus roseus]